MRQTASGHTARHLSTGTIWFTGAINHFNSSILLRVNLYLSIRSPAPSSAGPFLPLRAAARVREAFPI